MKWTSHKILTGAVVFTVTGNPIMTALSSIGSIIPDAVEGFPNEFNYNQWRQNHRQYSHWFVPYLITFFLCYSFSIFHGFRSLTINDLVALFFIGDLHYSTVIGAFIVTFLALGACFHILEDAVCGKIPGIDPKEKIGVKVFYVGSMKEYAIVFPLSLMLILLRFKMDKLI